MNLQEQHERILYSVVRVRSEKAGGSGTVIFSQPTAQNPNEYNTLVMTNHHVISDAISRKKEWDSLLKREMDREVLKQVAIEIFDYVHLSEVNSANIHRADIVAYDPSHDIAILKLDSPKPHAYPAKLIPREQIPQVKLFTPIWTSGCSLLHDPFTNPGYITYLKEDIENRLYWMCNANSIFGNSGGGVFLAETGEQIGITARITGLQLGFGFDIMTWMGFFVAPQRLYEFFEEQELRFLFDSSDTYEAAMERRKKKQEEARWAIKREDDKK